MVDKRKKNRPTCPDCGVTMTKTPIDYPDGKSQRSGWLCECKVVATATRIEGEHGGEDVVVHD